MARRARAHACRSRLSSFARPTPRAARPSSRPRRRARRLELGLDRRELVARRLRHGLHRRARLLRAADRRVARCSCTQGTRPARAARALLEALVARLLRLAQLAARAPDRLLELALLHRERAPLVLEPEQPLVLLGRVRHRALRSASAEPERAGSRARSRAPDARPRARLALRERLRLRVAVARERRARLRELLLVARFCSRASSARGVELGLDLVRLRRLRELDGLELVLALRQLRAGRAAVSVWAHVLCERVDALTCWRRAASSAATGAAASSLGGVGAQPLLFSRGVVVVVRDRGMVVARADGRRRRPTPRAPHEHGLGFTSSRCGGPELGAGVRSGPHPPRLRASLSPSLRSSDWQRDRLRGRVVVHLSASGWPRVRRARVPRSRPPRRRREARAPAPAAPPRSPKAAARAAAPERTSLDATHELGPRGRRTCRAGRRRRRASPGCAGRIPRRARRGRRRARATACSQRAARELRVGRAVRRRRRLRVLARRAGRHRRFRRIRRMRRCSVSLRPPEFGAALVPHGDAAAARARATRTQNSSSTLFSKSSASFARPPLAGLPDEAAERPGVDAPPRAHQ